MTIPFCPTDKDGNPVIHSDTGTSPMSIGEVFVALGIRGRLKEFHTAMNVPIASYPRIPSDDRVRLRLKLIAEEFFETMEAALGLGTCSHLKKLLFEHINNDALSVDMVGFIDGLCDLDYVVEGSRLEFGVDGGPVLAEVHAANMRKVDGPVREDGKRLKPEGWVGPDLARVLKEQGWKGV